MSARAFLPVAVLAVLALAGSRPSRAQTSPLVGVWAEAGKCREAVTVFTAEGHYFEMVADRTQVVGSEVWSVVKGVYDAPATHRRPPFRFELSTNWAMESMEVSITSATASAVRGNFVSLDMANDTEELIPFRWVRCPTSASDEWPY